MIVHFGNAFLNHPVWFPANGLARFAQRLQPQSFPRVKRAVGMEWCNGFFEISVNPLDLKWQKSAEFGPDKEMLWQSRPLHKDQWLMSNNAIRGEPWCTTFLDLWVFVLSRCFALAVGTFKGTGHWKVRKDGTTVISHSIKTTLRFEYDYAISDIFS